jgi:hypothetical protein
LRWDWRGGLEYSRNDRCVSSLGHASATRRQPWQRYRKIKLAEASAKNLQPQRPRLETQPAEKAQKICSLRGRGLKHSLLRTLQQQKFKELQLQSFGGAGERHPQLQRSGLARHTASLLNARISKHALCRIPGCKHFFGARFACFFVIGNPPRLIKTHVSTID